MCNIRRILSPVMNSQVKIFCSTYILDLFLRSENFIFIARLSHSFGLEWNIQINYKFCLLKKQSRGKSSKSFRLFLFLLFFKIADLMSVAIRFRKWEHDKVSFYRDNVRPHITSPTVMAVPSSKNRKAQHTRRDSSAWSRFGADSRWFFRWDLHLHLYDFWRASPRRFFFFFAVSCHSIRIMNPMTNRLLTYPVRDFESLVLLLSCRERLKEDQGEKIAISNQGKISRSHQWQNFKSEKFKCKESWKSILLAYFWRKTVGVSKDLWIYEISQKNFWIEK